MCHCGQRYRPVKEVITEDENGRMVDFFDRTALVEKVCDLLEDAAARKRLGRNARAFVVQNYDLRTVCLPQQLEWVGRLAQKDPRHPME